MREFALEIMGDVISEYTNWETLAQTGEEEQ